MRLAKGEEYGLRLAMALAVEERQLTVAELAEREGLPEPTVAKILASLRRAGVVEAARGRQGGYELAAPAGRTSVLSVLRAIDGPLFQGSFCRQEEHDESGCVHERDCSLLPVWLHLEQLIEHYLSGLSLADIATGHGGGPSGPVPVIWHPSPRRSAAPAGTKGME